MGANYREDLLVSEPVKQRARLRSSYRFLSYAVAVSADPIIYCLERLTDYRDFERLCSPLLASAGYTGIDPLGGTGDEGRDAIIRSDEAGRKIAFAYTVRPDWQTKLAHDCKRVHEMGHAPHVFVFVCTEALSASAKDSAYAFVREKYGWNLDLFDLERLRVELAGPQHHLIAQHPSIFTPPFFPQRGGQSVSESRDTLLIDHVSGDHALATWLARRMSLAGYRTWCRGTAPLAGENEDDTVRKLLHVRAAAYLPVLSSASFSDGEFLERCTIAAAKDDFALPCSTLIDYRGVHGPSRLMKMAPAYFNTSWNTGLEQVLARLAALGIAPSLDTDRGRQIALRDYLPTRIAVAKPEPVFANVFPLQLPKKMLAIDLRRALTEQEIVALRARWAFAVANNNTLVAFTPPPNEAVPAVKVDRTPEFLWESREWKDGKKTFNLAKELAWRSLEVICAEKGLTYCADRNVFYFPAHQSGEDWNQSFVHVDGRSTTVQLTGMRTKGYGDHASPFLYQLAPRFSPQCDSNGVWTMTLRIYIRTTTLEGTLFEEKEIGRRRKIVSKSWWNQQWLARLLGVVQALETTAGHIEVGTGPMAVVMGTKPLSWECPVGLDVLALSGPADIGQEIATYRAREDDDSGDDTSNNLQQSLDS
jgi:Restriction endonuclease